MTIRYTLLLFVLFLVAIVANASEASDSIDVRTDSLRREVKLSEVVVKARGASVVQDGISYVPSKTARKVAFNPADLLRRMPISNITVSLDGTKVQNMFKEDAVFFINGKKATELDVETLLPKDVKRVLVLENPSDPKYRSEKFVVDYITDPTYGGYVILRPAHTFFTDNGWYEALGKVVTGKSTFMAKGNFRHSDRKGGYSTRLEQYNLTDIATGELMELSRTVKDYDRVKRNRYWNAAAEWQYDASKYETHDLAIQYSQDKTPVQSSHGLVDNQSTFSRSATNTESLGAYYDYSRFFQNGSSFSATVSLGYNTTDGSSSYINEGYAPIYNSQNETFYRWMAALYYSLPFTHNNRMAFRLLASNNYFTVDYSGTANQRRKTRTGMYNLSVDYDQTFTHGENRFKFSASAELPLREMSQHGGRHVSSFDYTARVDLNSYFGNSHTLGFQALGVQYGVPVTAFSGVTIQQTELTGKTGNDRLSPSQAYRIRSSYTWLATNSFNISASLFYLHHMNVNCARYFLSDGVVYTQTVNSGINSAGGLSVGATLRFLDDTFTFYAGGSAYKDYANGLFNYNLWVVSPYVQLLYMHPKGFTAMLYYRPPGGKEPSGSVLSRNLQSQFYFNAGYKTGNFHVMVYCEPLYKFTHTRNYIERDGVSIIDDNHTGFARYFNIDLKYVIDFGKKQRHDGNIRTAISTETSL